MAVNGTSCRPPYEERSARISILANGIAARPDTFVQTVRASCKNHLPTGRAIRLPPAAERCALICVESIICVSIDRPFPESSRNRFSQTPRRGPADKAVINRRRRAILGRAVAPAATAFQYVHNTADDAAIISSFDPAHVRRQVRFDPLPLLIAQPK
jgi:hypothetical protein